MLERLDSGKRRAISFELRRQMSFETKTGEASQPQVLAVLNLPLQQLRQPPAHLEACKGKKVLTW